MSLPEPVPGPRHRRRARAAALAAAATTLSGCSLLASPTPPPAAGPSLAPPGALGYVVCPTAVTPVELTTHTAEADIPLPVRGTPALGDFAIATSPDGRWAYVVTSDGVESHSAPSASSTPPAVSGAASSAVGTSSTTPSGVALQNVLIPIDLVTQQAGAPIRIPGQGGTHAVVVLPGGRTVLAASGSSIVPVDTTTRRVGNPLDLGPGRTIFGMALDPGTPTVYALVAGGVFPVDTSDATAGVEIPTGLSVSSVYSPHGIDVSPDGRTVYVVGQGGTDFGGRLLPIVAATGTTQPAAGFDRFGIADPAALAVTEDGSQVVVADAANNWINPVPVASFSDPPPPVRLPDGPSGAPRSGTSPSGTSPSGTAHPTDIVMGPGATGAFVVDGFDTVLPYAPGDRSFGRPIPVCSGASSMAVGPAP